MGSGVGIRQVGYFDCAGGGQVVVENNIAYVAHMRSPHGTSVIDVSDPTNPKELGEEVAIGKGKVDFPRIIARLKELNYRGAVTIEREISGAQQMEDVRAAIVYLEKLIG